ncbi:MAG: GNAT family N-acetyltransferase [Gallionellaceae bacterium]|nr:MAG: GNAT family N-acetyltransferase [Gallionellaceae bacterium]
MPTSFTLHCIEWRAGEPLFQDVRIAACASGLLDAAEMGADDTDEISRHALALTKGGRAIGCARLTPAGRIDRIAVMPHERRDQIESGLIEVLRDHAKQTGVEPVIIIA